MEHLKGNYYHFYNRGFDGNRIFFDSQDYLYLLRLVKEYQIRYDIQVIAYCLIPNHYHFLLFQKSGVPVSRFIQTLFNTYVQGLNKKMHRRGTLFEGRAKSKWVDNEEYLIHLCRYIHINPIKHMIVEDLLDWEYSNYFEFIGMRKGSLYDKHFVSSHYEDPNIYGDWVEEYVEGSSDFDKIKDYLLE